MKWAEVIMVRATGRSAKPLDAALKELMNDIAGNAGDKSLRVFHREKLDTDICIVLFHTGKKTRPGGSPLAQRIVAALKEFGLVHHTIWNEME